MQFGPWHTGCEGQFLLRTPEPGQHRLQNQKQNLWVTGRSLVCHAAILSHSTWPDRLAAFLSEKLSEKPNKPRRPDMAMGLPETAFPLQLFK